MDEGREFDFLEGQWDAVCRVPSEEGWVAAPGTLTASRTLGGLVFLELFEGIYHGGPLKGLGLRAFNREAHEWEHTWTDNLDPGHFHVWKGVFRDGKIDLFGEWIDGDGKPVRSRLTWSDITQDSAHWESARSADDGETWQLHWVIDWRRRR
ncbi:MAG TPA: DUF1579 family protein [Thermoanaerobaculia bacterium]|nr:DUF1579 family protein [Thermoanaerobaculia bacterium]